MMRTSETDLELMTPKSLHSVVKSLAARGVSFAAGLSDREVAAAEAAVGVHFPPDLRGLLQYRTPVGDGFPDWRDPASASVRDRLNRPAEGVCFDVEHNEFWMSAWGPRPPSIEDAKAIARRAVRNAPRLIPIYSHRFMPAEPCDVGNPVFSVYQTDIIVYGSDLLSYLHAEFGVPIASAVPTRPRPIRFWDELVD